MKKEGKITKTEIATLIRNIGEDELSAQNRMFVSLLWSVWETIGEEGIEDTVSEAEAEHILSQFPLVPDEEIQILGETELKDREKLDEDELDQVYEWREMGLSYGNIASLVEDGFGKQVDQSTIYRYCQDADLDVEA